MCVRGSGGGVRVGGMCVFVVAVGLCMCEWGGAPHL